MESQKTKVQNTAIIIIAGVCWMALLGQLYLILSNRKLSIAGTIVQYLSYFTILSNLLVAISSTFILLNIKRFKFLSKPTVLTAITLYISVVGIVYNVILRFLWAPQGIQKLIDELLHTAIPILFIMYWIYYVPKGILQWKNVYLWLGFPFIYCIYILCRGAATGLYPYPFIDVVNLGYKNVCINIGFLVLAFLLIGLFFIAIAKLTSKNYVKTSRL